MSDVAASSPSSHWLRPGDRLEFDGRRPTWLIRAIARPGRYAVATSSLFGVVRYTVMDRDAGIRGPVDVVGGGMGIETTSGPESSIDELVRMLEDGWEVSHRNNIPTKITRIRRDTTNKVLKEEEDP